METLTIIVKDSGSELVVRDPTVFIDDEIKEYTTSDKGEIELDLQKGKYAVVVEAFGKRWPSVRSKIVEVPSDPVEANLNINAEIKISRSSGAPTDTFVQGDKVLLSAIFDGQDKRDCNYSWRLRNKQGQLQTLNLTSEDKNQKDVEWVTSDLEGQMFIEARITDMTSTGESITPRKAVAILSESDIAREELASTREIATDVRSLASQGRSNDPVTVNLQRTGVSPTEDQMLWVTIRNRTNAIRFSGSGYADFINRVLCRESVDLSSINEDAAEAIRRRRRELLEPVHGVGAYELLKTATQVFLLLECGAVVEEFDRYSNAEERLFDPTEESRRLGRTMSIDQVQESLEQYLEPGRLPYLHRVLRAVYGADYDQNNRAANIFCQGFLGARADCPPMLELIWSYWHEEAMQVQAMKAISLRFQNRRSKSTNDPLAHLEISPLHPLNNLLWGYIQDEVHRLSVPRRNYEFSHQYGLKLQGQAVSDFEPADNRSRFLEAFHNLLFLTTQFYKQDDDTTFVADGFSILNALREVHLVLAEGAHNQFGDLPWTARAEMLMEQWILSRPEIRRFLQSRDMVPYLEEWMPQVDAMNKLQGWTDVSVTHFNYLAIHGEQILLSIRYGDWIDSEASPDQAANWARYWRSEIQNYIHSYRAATGVNLAADARDSRQAELRVTQPSKLLLERSMNGQSARTSVGETASTETVGFRQRRPARRTATTD